MMLHHKYVLRNVTTTIKIKRGIKRALLAGTPEHQIKKRFNRGHKLISSIKKTPESKLSTPVQTNRGSVGDSKYFLLLTVQNCHLENSLRGLYGFFRKSM